MKKVKLVTHAGIFHADEVIGTVFLRKFFSLKGDYTSLERVYRVSSERLYRVSKNPNPDTVIYDIGEGEFDHHQEGGNGTRENGVPYSSLGLLWREFGEEFSKLFLKEAGEEEIRSEEFENFVDVNFIQGIDATDCGYQLYPKQNSGGTGERPRTWSLSALLGIMNPFWEEEGSFPENEAFEKACELASLIFERQLQNAVSNLKAKVIYQDLKSRQKELGGTQRIFVMDNFIPWQNLLIPDPDLEEVRFIIFSSKRGGWMVQTIPVSPGSFEYRTPLLKEWWGIRDKDLQTLSGIQDASFVHPTGFIGGAETKASAILMAEKSLQ